MSGPKDYAPPPMYSMSVFDGKLNEVFKLQCQLKEIIEDLKIKGIDDKELNIIINTNLELKEQQIHNTKALKPLIFSYKGKFNQDTYNKINKEIDDRIKLLQKQLRKSEQTLLNTEKKINNYHAYKAYLNFHRNATSSFTEFKKNIVKYLNTHVKENKLLNEAVKNIENIHIKNKQSNFLEGFCEKDDALRQELTSEIFENETHINQIRGKLTKEILKKHHTVKLPDEEANEVEKQEITRVKNNILTLIHNCSNRTKRLQYQANFDKLNLSDALNTSYYYKELHDKILESEKQAAMREEINKSIIKLNHISLHEILSKEKASLTYKAIDLLESSFVKKQQLENLKIEIEILLKKNSDIIENENIQEKERIFLKTQIIHNLENLGYEVMEDMEVIDFEKNDDFLLKINNQENYLNLKFKEDGSFRYVFQIPEKKEDLTLDKQKMKLHEMEVTCQEFQSVLSELKQMGLNLNLRSAKPVALSSIISVSENHLEKIKKRKTKTLVKSQVKKRYLE